MNIIARPEASVTNEEAPKKAEISPEERARRKAAVGYARGSVRLEGFVVTPFAEDLYSRYIDGELTLKEVGVKLLAHHNP
jgi:hypothetical protein